MKFFNYLYPNSHFTTIYQFSLTTLGKKIFQWRGGRREFHGYLAKKIHMSISGNRTRSTGLTCPE